MVLIIRRGRSYWSFRRGLFPSPCGDYGSYPRRCYHNKDFAEKMVSVPLRGLWFLSDRVERNNVLDYICVSVPLRGLWFLSTRIIEDIHDYDE